MFTQPKITINCQKLYPLVLGSPFIELQSVDSTNNYARALISKAQLPERQGEISHGQVIFAYEQLQGKGQRGKSWVSQKGANIAMSILFNPNPLTPHLQFRLNACIALSVCEFFQKFAGEETRIKWPNDLYWQDRKAGGILIESIISGNHEWNWAIVGIGININQTSFPPEIPNPVSLKQITGKNWEPVALARELCKVIDKNYRELFHYDFESFLQKYNQYLYKKGKEVRLKKDSRVFNAVIKEVNESGKLVVLHAIEEEFDFGTIEWESL